MKHILTQSLAKHFLNTGYYSTSADRGTDWVDNSALQKLAKAILAEGKFPTYEVVLSFLTPFGCHISKKEYDTLLSIKPVRMSLPLSRELARAVLGRRLSKDHPDSPMNRNMGVYVFTHKVSGKQYVGGSINLAHRVRSYFSLGEPTRLVKRMLKHHGIEAFYLDIYKIDPKDFDAPKPVSLVYGLEQHLIFALNPVYNVNKMAAGQHTTLGYLNSKEMSTAVNSKPIYLYNHDKTILLSTSPSRIKMSQDLNISTSTITRYVKSGDKLYGKFVISQVLIPNVDTYEMPHDEINNLFAEGSANQTLSVLDSNRRRMTPVTLIDLTVDDKPEYHFKTMKAAADFTESYGTSRRLYKQLMTESRDAKGWRIIKHPHT